MHIRPDAVACGNKLLDDEAGFHLFLTLAAKGKYSVGEFCPVLPHSFAQRKACTYCPFIVVHRCSSPFIACFPNLERNFGN